MRGGRYQHRPYHLWYGRCFIYFKLYQSKILLKKFLDFLKNGSFCKGVAKIGVLY